MATTISSGVNAFNPSSVGGTSTSLQMFPALASNFTAASTGASTVSALVCSVPANGQYEQQQMTVIASGKFFVHGTSPTQVWKMYNGNSLTVATNGTAILTMSALTGLTTNAWYPWAWKSVFQGDSSSGILQAINSTLWVDNATAGTITLTGIASGLNLIANGPANLFGPGYTAPTGVQPNNAGINFSIAFQQTVSDAKNICYCSQFCVVTD